MYNKYYFKDEKEVLIMLGDTILELDLKKFLRNKNSVLGVKKITTPSLFGVAELDDQGYIKKLVEKPKIPKSNLGLVGIYKMKNPRSLFEATDNLIHNQIKTHEEFQLTDALMNMINQGEKMVTFQVDNWYDCGKKESVLEANEILFNNPKFKKKPSGFPNSVFIPPVSIGKNCKVINSIIGPNVSLGDNTMVSYSIVKNTIVGSFSELKNTMLEDSIIGNDTSLEGLNQSLNIGDNTEIHFSHP